MNGLQPTPLLALAALSASLVWAAPDWEPVSPGYGGIVGQVRSFARKDSNLYVAGTFRSIGGLKTGGIARWDGRSWHTLGSGLDGTAYSVCTGPGEMVAVSGIFNTAGGKPAVNVAIWNGTEWNAVMEGALNGVPVAVGVPTVACGDDSSIYVGGMVNSIGSAKIPFFARFKNGAWTRPGGGLDYTVQTLAKGPDGRIYAGGSFSHAGDSTANRLAIWDGQKWSRMGKGIVATAAAINAFAFGPDGTVCITGDFSTVGGKAASNVACWNGTDWTALGSGLDGDGQSAFFDSKGRLVVVGNFLKAGNVATTGVARWFQGQWESLHPSIGASKTSPDLSAGTEDVAGRLWIGFYAGRTGFAGNATGAAILEDGIWHGLGVGMNGQVSRLLTGPEGELVVTGQFLRIGDTPVGGMARYKNGRWTSMRDSMTGLMEDFARTPDGRYLAVGTLTKIDGVPVKGMAEWSDGTWKAWGQGPKGSVRIVEVADNGNIAVGGQFDTLDGVSARNLAFWTGATGTWKSLPTQGDATPSQLHSLSTGGWLLQYSSSNLIVRLEDSTITVVANAADSRRQLYSDGKATWAYNAGKTSYVVERPEGRDSFSLPQGTYLSTMTFDKDHNPIVSLTDTSSAIVTYSVRRYTRTGWETLGSTFDRLPRHLAVDTTANLLYAGGDFLQVGDRDAAYLVRIPLERNTGLESRAHRVGNWFAGQGRGLRSARSGTLRIYSPQGVLERSIEVEAGANLTDLVTSSGMHFLRLGTETRALMVAAPRIQP